MTISLCSLCLSPQDIVISVVFAVIFFCLAIATAVYAGEFNDKARNFNNIRNDVGAVSVSLHKFQCAYMRACVQWECTMYMNMSVDP